MNIDFFTFITKGSADYAEFLKKSCDTFASGEHTVNWKCVESVDTDRLPEGYECVAKGPVGNHNSMNHSLAMNEALKHIQSDYVIFADADIAITYQNWDKIVVENLNEHSCFGFSYGDSSPKYKDFPIVYFFCFRRDMAQDVELDFRPKLNGSAESPARYQITDSKEAEYFNRSVGDQMKCDTGWRLPLLIRDKGYTGKSMPRVLGKSKNSQLPFVSKEQKRLCLSKPEHMAEWHYDGKLFGTHKQASRNHPLAGDWGSAWASRINAYTEKEYGVEL